MSDITVIKTTVENLEDELRQLDDPELPATDVLSLTIAPVRYEEGFDVWEAVLITRVRPERPPMPDFEAMAAEFAAANAAEEAAENEGLAYATDTEADEDGEAV